MEVFVRLQSPLVAHLFVFFHAHQHDLHVHKAQNTHITEQVCIDDITVSYFAHR